MREEKKNLTEGGEEGQHIVKGKLLPEPARCPVCFSDMTEIASKMVKVQFLKLGVKLFFWSQASI